MGLFSWIFGNETQAIKNTASPQNKHSTAIQFHPDLVERLVDDHRNIVAIYSEILALINGREYGSIANKVSEFKRLLQAHVIVENVQFYTYLEQLLSDDPTNLDFIQDVRKEMNGIAHAVVQFSRKYEKISFNDDIQQEFTTDLEAIGEVLTQRVAMEEKQLYTLYKEK